MRGGLGEEQVPLMRGGGQQIPSIFEKPRNAEVEGGVPEQKIATY